LYANLGAVGADGQIIGPAMVFIEGRIGGGEVREVRHIKF
jgi:hypothetical protein